MRITLLNLYDIIDNTLPVWINDAGTATEYNSYIDALQEVDPGRVIEYITQDSDNILTIELEEV